VPRFLAIHAMREVTNGYLPECGQQNLGSERVLLIQGKLVRRVLGWRVMNYGIWEDSASRARSNAITGIATPKLCLFSRPESQNESG
jgi:hypothetical protein